MLARHVMTHTPSTIAADASIGDALALLASLDVRHLPVVDGGKRLVGMLSDRDLQRFLGPGLMTSEDVQRRLALPVTTVMTGDPIAATPQTPITEVIDALMLNRVGGIAIIDEQESVVGFVSYLDLLRELRAFVE